MNDSDWEILAGHGVTPDNLTVGENLYLGGALIYSLPEGLTVGGHLFLHDTPITSLPDGLTVGGGLDLRGTNIASLPKGLEVGGRLILHGTPITSIPESLTVGSDLGLGDTKITSLPKSLTVGGSLDLRGAPITSLPEGLTVGGHIDLRGTPITSLPDGLTCGPIWMDDDDTDPGSGTDVVNPDGACEADNAPGAWGHWMRLRIGFEKMMTVIKYLLWPPVAILVVMRVIFALAGAPWVEPTSYALSSVVLGFFASIVLMTSSKDYD